MWVGRSRIGLAAVLGLTATLLACDSTKSATLSGVDVPTVNSLQPGDAAPAADAAADASDAATDAAWCKPPYDCADASAWDAAPPTKDGATTALDAGGAGFCARALLAYDSRSLKATGPTPAFVNAYNAALATAPFGPFVVEVAGSNGTSTAAYIATFAGVAQASGKVADTTEPGSAYAYLVTPGVMTTLQIAKAEKPFHLAFTRALDPAGDILAAGIELTATMDDSGCSSMPSVTATLYIAQSQASAPLGGSTLGQLLGATNATLASGAGWAIALSGSAQEITLQ